MVYVYLAITILAEVIAAVSLKATEEFTRPIPSIVVIVGYAVSFYFLTLVLKTLPLGITYAIWSGVGIVLVTLAGVFLYKQVPDWPAVIGMGLIVLGVAVIHLFSKTVEV